MTGQSFYLLDEEELMKITDLCDGLNLAIEKTIRSRRLLREFPTIPSAVSGFQQMLDEADVEAEDLNSHLSKIF